MPLQRLPGPALVDEIQCAPRLLPFVELAVDRDRRPSRLWLRFAVLEASGIVVLLEACHANATKRLVKAPKLQFLDTGLCFWLTEWSNPETLEAGAASVAMLGTWILAETLESRRQQGRRAPFN